MYQSEVLGQRLNTRDELGFEMDGVGEDVDEDWSSTMTGSLVMSLALISPFRREVSLTESLLRRAKVLLLMFRLETAALRPESLLFIFFLGQNPSYS